LVSLVIIGSTSTFRLVISCTVRFVAEKNTKFEWFEKTEQAFVDIKSRLASRPILVPPDYSKPFIVAVDASDFAIGASLIQEVDGLECSVCFISRKLTPQQRNYSVIEKEAFALLTAVRLVSVYFGSEPVKVFTDHSPLQFLNRMSMHNQKLLRWNLELQQYNLQIFSRPGRNNILPDILSRPSV